MRTIVKYLIGNGMFALALASAPASAATLLNLINPAAQNNTPFSLSFTATLASTTLSVAGYQLPQFFTVKQNAVRLAAGPNLLGSTWIYTPASSGAYAIPVADGSSVNGLAFAGSTEGSYDTFTQTFATAIGSTYTYSFLFSNDTSNAPSGLRIDVNAAAGTDAVPEPATWGMMLAGFGAMGFAMRRRAKVRTNVSFA